VDPTVPLVINLKYLENRNLGRLVTVGTVSKTSTRYFFLRR
jgi:hypothetical protein